MVLHKAGFMDEYSTHIHTHTPHIERARLLFCLFSCLATNTGVAWAVSELMIGTR